MSLTPDLILSSPDYYPLQFEGGNLVFVHMSRASYGDSIFMMPSRIVTASDQAWSVPFAEVVRLTESPQQWQSAELLLQIAHCGSTLLSRALDVADRNLVIREPYALRQLLAASSGSGAAQQQDYVRALRALWRLLSRRYAADQPVLIKGNVPFNFKLRALIQASGLKRAAFLYSGLQDYQLAIAKDPQRGEWAKHVLHESSAELKRVAEVKYESLSDLQAATLLWSSQLAMRDAESAHADIYSMKSENLFRSPQPLMAACDKHLQLNLNERLIAERANSELFGQHAKNPKLEYSAKRRADELAKLRRKYQPQLDAATAWGQALELPYL